MGLREYHFEEHFYNSYLHVYCRIQKTMKTIKALYINTKK